MSERRYRILRLDGPPERVSQRVYHAVRTGAISALCGQRPYGRGQWFPIEGQAVTCKRCLRRVAMGDTD
jgi:hypothetical protein